MQQRSKSHRKSWKTAATLGFALLTACVPAVRAQEGANPLHTATRTELDVAKAVLTQEKAWNAGDIAGYVKGYKDSPDTLFLGRQISRGFSQILEDYEHNYPNRASMGTLTFSELEAHSISDTFAVCIGKYHLDRGKKDGGNADGFFSLVLEKTPDGWKIILDHTT
jgi:ketosteroid isomerase-like protein